MSRNFAAWDYDARKPLYPSGVHNMFDREDRSTMKQRDAEIAVAIQIQRENPQMTDENALDVGEHFIRNGRWVVVNVDKGNRKGTYYGGDGFHDRRSFKAMDSVKLV